ncbi:MAG: M48 family metallopeptidase [Endomicrobium sp.]|jgi:predicted metal-dependent hydrolase|nr:M48 family metallopeptidase [Endomicrobium sp.]
MEKIKIEEIEAVIERKRIKNLYISIHSSSGEVYISAPLKTSQRAIEIFFASKIAWIRRHKAKISARPPKTFNDYVTGEYVEVLGKKYMLKVFDYAGEPKVFLNFDSVDMYISSQSAINERKEAVDDFYKSKLKEIVPPFILKWEKQMGIYNEPSSLKFLFKNIQSKFNLFDNGIEKETVILKNPVKIVYKKMKGKWGLCHISDKKITLNTELAKKSAECVEYVAAHELLHLKERKHNKRFKDYMKKAFPNWKKLEAELEGYV